MSVPPGPRDPDWTAPTMPLGRAPEHGPAATDRTRLFMWAAVAGALVVVVLAVVTVAFAGGDDAENSGRAPVAAPPTDAATPEESRSVPTEASPSDLPPTKPSPRPSLRPAQLIAGLEQTVAGLVGDWQLARDDGKDLTKRLREAADELADGDVEKAWEKLSEFAEKAAKLRKDGKLSATGYQSLAAGLAQLGQVMPRTNP